MIPQYARLDIAYDAESILQEINSTRDHWQPLTVHRKWVTHPPEFCIGTREMLDSVPFFQFINGKHHFTTVSDKQAYNFGGTVNLREHPEHPEAITGSISFKAVGIGEWTWNPKFNTPVIRDLAERLGYDSLTTVRIMQLDPPAFFPVHSDLIPENAAYFEDGFNGVDINVLLAAGGDSGCLQVQLRDGSIITADTGAMTFDERLLHGLEPISASYTILKFCGIMSPERFNDLIVADSAIW